jgi:AcrR family transcriptional regulator
VSEPPQTKARRTQKERVEESARRLVDAALELIAEKGFERTTAAEIGERAGYSRSMVRDRYGSKEALLESLFATQFEARLLPAARTTRKTTGLGRVLGQLDDLERAIRTEPDIMRALIVLSFEAPGPLGSVRAWYAQMIAHYEAEMVESLAAGEADGSIRGGLDRRAEAEGFVSYGIGLCFRWTLDPDGYDFPARIRAWRRRLERRYRPA